MSEHKVTISLELGRRQLIALAALALVAFHPGELSTEQLTLNTYYPSPYGVYEEMRSRNNTYLAYAAGNVGIGKTSAGARLDVNGTTILGGNTTVNGNETINGNETVTGTLGVGGSYTDQYATGLSVRSRNVHVQGNENGGWLRLGDAWGMNGVYSQSGDLVLGSASGRVRIGPNDSQYISQACRVVGYGGGQTFCPTNWTVMGPANQQVYTEDFQTMPGNGGWHTLSRVTSNAMICCKLSTN